MYVCHASMHDFMYVYVCMHAMIMILFVRIWVKYLYAREKYFSCTSWTIWFLRTLSGTLFKQHHGARFFAWRSGRITGVAIGSRSRSQLPHSEGCSCALQRGIVGFHMQKSAGVCARACLCMCVLKCVCVHACGGACVRERKRERDRERYTLQIGPVRDTHSRTHTYTQIRVTETKKHTLVHACSLSQSLSHTHIHTRACTRRAHEKRKRKKKDACNVLLYLIQFLVLCL